jgi:regulatory protein
VGKGLITALEVQKRNKQRVNVFIDGEFAFGLSLIEAARLRKGQVLSEAEIAGLHAEDIVQQALDSAAHFMSYRPRSIQEVRRNLKEKDLSPEAIEAAVSRLQEMGYLDDEAFARFWVKNRNEFKPLSHRALRQELRQKGIADAIISGVLSEQNEFDMAYQAASSHLRKLRNRTLREFRQKMSAFLQRRGFTYSTVEEVVSRLKTELEADDPDYFQRMPHEDN